MRVAHDLLEKDDERPERPPLRSVLNAIYGEEWGFTGHAAGCTVGWLTHLDSRVLDVVAVGGQPAAPPVPQVTVRGRSKTLRRLLNPTEVTLLEAVARFDECAEVQWHEALRLFANAPLSAEVRSGPLLDASSRERGNGARRLRERIAEICSIVDGTADGVVRDYAVEVGAFPARRLAAAEVPALMLAGWRGRRSAVAAYVKAWAHECDMRADMCRDEPRGPNRLDLVRIAAVVHALCDRDSVEIPAWVWRHRWHEDVCLTERIPIDGTLGVRIRSTAVSACAYHHVWFDAEHILDHRVHGIMRATAAGRVTPR